MNISALRYAIVLACVALVSLGQTASAQDSPVVVRDVTVNCGPNGGGVFITPPNGGPPTPPPGPHYEQCGLNLINLNRSDRVVASVRRRMSPRSDLIMWDYQWAQSAETLDQDSEVLLRPGQALPLTSSLLVDEPTPTTRPQFHFAYEVLGYVVPRADDINDRPSEDAQEYLRIFESRRYLTNYCTSGGVTHPPIHYRLFNLHLTRRIAVLYRNTADRHGGSNASWQTVYVDPSAVDRVGGVGCVVDRQQNKIEIRSVRFVN